MTAFKALARVGVPMGMLLMAVHTNAQQVRRTGESLRNQTSTFVQVSGPVTEFRSTGAGGTSVEVIRPVSEWTLKGVPNTRVVATRDLLSRLNARQTTDATVVVDLPTDVLFDFDRAVLRADASKTVAQLRTLLDSFPTATVSVDGHADGLGTASYNYALGLQRAQALAAAIGGNRPDKSLLVNSFGSSRPLLTERHADGSDNAEARQRNRRVSVVINAAS